MELSDPQTHCQQQVVPKLVVVATETRNLGSHMLDLNLDSQNTTIFKENLKESCLKAVNGKESKSKQEKWEGEKKEDKEKEDGVKEVREKVRMNGWCGEMNRKDKIEYEQYWSR